MKVNRFDSSMAYLLNKLKDKKSIDDAIRGTEDLVLVLRFGREHDGVCMQLDDIVRNLPILSIGIVLFVGGVGCVCCAHATEFRGAPVSSADAVSACNFYNPD